MSPLPQAPEATDLHSSLALLSGPPSEVADGLAFTRVGRDPGTAPTLLLVHGVGAARVVWAPILPALVQTYDVLVVDLPGHGESLPLALGENARCTALARRLAVACAELAVARPHVVGNSLGGWIGLEMAADGTARSLTALAPAGLRRVPARPNKLLYLNRFLARTTGAAADPLLGLRVVRAAVFSSGSADPAGLDPQLARQVVRALRHNSAYEAMLDATAHSRFDRKKQVGVPTAVVFGDRDRILPRPNQHREMAPDHATWQVLPRCGHAPMWDAPARTVEIIDEVVRS